MENLQLEILKHYFSADNVPTDRFAYWFVQGNPKYKFKQIHEALTELHRKGLLEPVPNKQGILTISEAGRMKYEAEVTAIGKQALYKSKALKINKVTIGIIIIVAVILIGYYVFKIW